MHKLLWIVPALIAFLVPEANATPFDWSFSGVYTSGPGIGGSISGSGTLDAIFSSGTEYVVDSMSGTANGNPVTLNSNTGLSGYAINDNLLFYPGSPNQLDFNGLSFIAGGNAFDLYYQSSSSGTPSGYDCGFAGYCLLGPGTNGTSGLDNGGDPLATISFSASPVAATPLPATWSMLLIGFIGLGFVAYRGTKKGPAAFVAA